MTTMSLENLEAAFRLWDVPYTADDVVDGRPTGEFIPEAVMWHHTAPGGHPSRPYPSRNVVREGRPDLPGPLYQLVVTRHPRIDIVTVGRANHAGDGGPSLGLSSGNRSFVGMAFEQLGTGAEPWDPAQLDVGARATAAVLSLLARPATRLKGHKEWTPRKPDPWQLDMDVWRRRVATLINEGPPVRATTQEADMLQIARYGERRFILDGNGKREITKTAATQLVAGDAARYVDGLNSATLNEFPTYAEDGTHGGSTQTELDQADDAPAGGV